MTTKEGSRKGRRQSTVNAEKGRSSKGLLRKGSGKQGSCLPKKVPRMEQKNQGGGMTKFRLNSKQNCLNILAASRELPNNEVEWCQLENPS